MSKKFISISSLSFIGLFTLSSFIGDVHPLALKLTATDNSQWVHYEKKEATEESVGIREYWVKCGGGYQFEKPNVSNIREGGTHDVSEFTTNDPRYIFWLDDTHTAFYNLYNSRYNYSEATQLEGYVGKNPSTTPGETTRIEFYKNDTSPMYVGNCLTASMVITNNSELETFQIGIEEGTTLTGYYVIANDLNSPGHGIAHENNIFSGTLDGRNHIITNPGFWNFRMLGITDGAIIKNIVFKEISVFSVLAFKMKNTKVENCYFYTADTLAEMANQGLLSDTIEGNSELKDVYIDFKDHYLINPGSKIPMSPVTAYDYVPIDVNCYDGVTLRCLSSLNAFEGSVVGRPLRPSEITYIPAHYFIKNGVSNYDIKYASGNIEAKYAAELIVNEVRNATGITLSATAVSSGTVYTNDTSSILIGLLNSLNSAVESFTMPTGEEEYIVKSVNKAVYIYANHANSYLPAAINFLETAIGFEYYGNYMRNFNVTDPKNVDICLHNTLATPSFKYRKVDWSDLYFLDDTSNTSGVDAMGYNENIGKYATFITIPQSDGWNHGEQFHTSTMLINPYRYFADHHDWYASYYTQESKTILGGTVDVLAYYGSSRNLNRTSSWGSYSYNPEFSFTETLNGGEAPNTPGAQLCYTAHGNATEYTALVNETVTRLVEAFKTNANANKIFFGTADNTICCQCETCQSKTTEYGSITGTVVNFANDVTELLNSAENLAAMGKDRIEMVIFSYNAYKAAPVVSDVAKITANDYVSTCVAPIEAHFTKPMTDPINTDSYANVVNWSKVGSCHSWFYETNFKNYLYPYNSFEATTQNLKIMDELGFDLAYFQGQHNFTGYRTGFNALKKYLNARFMIDSYRVYQDEVNKFFANYYGGPTTGAKMQQMFNEVVARLEYIESNESFQSILYNESWLSSCYQNISNAQLWDFDQLVSWNNLVEETYTLTSDTYAKKHIRAEGIFPKFALITLFPSKFSTEELNALKVTFMDHCNELGVEIWCESTYTSGSTTVSHKLEDRYFASWRAEMGI